MSKREVLFILPIAIAIVVFVLIFPLFRVENISALKQEVTLSEETPTGTQSVRIDSKGDVYVGFNGREIQSGSISEKGVSLLNSMFKSSKFFTFSNSYVSASSSGTITTISYSSTKRKKTVQVMEGVAHPNEFDNLISELTKLKKTASENSPGSSDHALDYSWVIGQLRYNRIEKYWELIFVDEASSPYEGRFILGNSDMLNGYVEGDKIRISGSIEGKPGFGGTQYEVKSVWKIIP